MSETVVVLGGSYSGLIVAHKLLKTTLAAVKNLKVVLVNPSDHFFYNIATVRAIIPGLFDEKYLFHDIPAGFAYAGKSFEFVLGKAEQVDTEAKTVSISTTGGTVTQSYDHLVVATGASTNDIETPWKGNGLNYAELKKSLKLVQDQVVAAKSIVVGGGGTTGVETAAELGYEFGKTKEITLITSGATILDNAKILSQAQVKSSEGELKKLNVKIVHNTRITGAKSTADGKTELTLSAGSPITVDLYLPTTGVKKASDYLPKSLVDEQGGVIVDENLRAKGFENVWAAGDVLSIQRAGVLNAKGQAYHVAKNLDLALKKQPLVAFKIPEKDVLAVTLGRSKAVGSSGGWKIPSIVIWFIKGRTFMGPASHGVVDGTDV